MAGPGGAPVFGVSAGRPSVLDQLKAELLRSVDAIAPLLSHPALCEIDFLAVLDTRGPTPLVLRVLPRPRLRIEAAGAQGT